MLALAAGSEDMLIEYLTDHEDVAQSDEARNRFMAEASNVHKFVVELKPWPETALSKDETGAGGTN